MSTQELLALASTIAAIIGGLVTKGAEWLLGRGKEEHTYEETWRAELRAEIAELKVQVRGCETHNDALVLENARLAGRMSGLESKIEYLENRVGILVEQRDHYRHRAEMAEGERDELRKEVRKLEERVQALEAHVGRLEDGKPGGAG